MGLRSFFKKLTPKDKIFFPMFEAAANNIVEAAEKHVELFNTEDWNTREKLFREIKDLEVRGDQITHNIFDELEKTFITPFDREDIHQLASSLDDVLDFINGSSQRIRLYKPRSFTPRFKPFAELMLKGCIEIRVAASELRNLKNPEKISNSCIIINDVENLADDQYHLILSELFENEKDAIELIKKKEIIQTMERATDRIEDVADVLKTIIIKVA